MSIRDTAANYLTPIIVYGLGVVCPAIPSAIWSILIKAIISGDITPVNIDAFLASFGLKTYYAPTDFPDSPPQATNVSNVQVKQP